MSKKGQAVITAVREVTDEQPNFVYKDACMYVVDGKPGCLVGQGLWRANLINEDFERTNLNELNVSVFRDAPWGFDPDEIEWLLDAQDAQDRGESWANAVEIADRKRAKRENAA